METLFEILERFPQDASFWTALVSALIGILAVIISSRFSPYTRKALTYRVVSDTPITEMSEEQGQSVVISFVGEPLKDARLIVLTIRNSGNTPIRPKDYDEPIQIRFKGGEVLTSQLFQSGEREKTQVLDTKAPDSVILPPLLLKPKDLITITTILTGFSSTINIETGHSNPKIIVAKTAFL